jgi:hypothetical protein
MGGFAMEKKILILAMALLLGWVVSASALPLDLGTFTAYPGATLSGSQVLFAESLDYASIYFFNDNFLVPIDANILSFNYDFGLGADDVGDYFTFDQDFVSHLFVNTDVLNGYFSVDLSPFRGTIISLAWGLIWGDDDFAGSTAKLYNLDLARADSTAPVPEPSTIMLFGTGIIGLLRYIRKKEQV